MKKVLAILLLCSVLVLSLAGCGKNANSDPLPQTPVAESNNPGIEQSEEQEDIKEDIVNNREPELPGALLVMVDNYAKARPQIGLDKADMVYEIVAEAGITRFMGVFYHRQAEKIGPIRSARYYFVQLAKGYDSPLAHAGGSEDSLNMLVSLKVKDLDEIYNAGGYFWRDKKRQMPHNLYSSTELLLKGAKDKGYSLVPLPALPLGQEWEGDARTSFTIDYSVDKYEYLVSWEYADKKYVRLINGKPHTMEDQTAITADNVAVISAKTKNIVKNKIVLSEIDIVGRGEALYFIDGLMIKGSWAKKSEDSPIQLLDAGGQPMKFRQGNIWIQVVPTLSSLSLE